MTLEYRQSLTELNVIMHYMDEECLKQIPQKFVDFVNKNMDAEYVPNISKNIPINEQNIKKDTKILLSLLYRKYWCDDETKYILAQKEKVKNEKNNKIISEKNDFNQFIANEKHIKSEVESRIELIEYKEDTLFKKIWANIKIFLGNIFRKR